MVDSLVQSRTNLAKTGIRIVVARPDNGPARDRLAPGTIFAGARTAMPHGNAGGRDRHRVHVSLLCHGSSCRSRHPPAWTGARAAPRGRICCLDRRRGGQERRRSLFVVATMIGSMNAPALRYWTNRGQSLTQNRLGAANQRGGPVRRGVLGRWEDRHRERARSCRQPAFFGADGRRAPRTGPG